MKKKIHKLSSVTFDYQFILIGISSHENDYRLSWAINNALNLQLNKGTNHVVHNPKINEDMEFSLFSYEDESTYVRYIMVSNRGDNAYLIPELKSFDFFFQVHGEISENEKNALVNTIKSIRIVSVLALLELEKIKSKKNLIII